MLGENWNDAGQGFHPVSAPDYLPAAQLRELQLRRLKAVVERAYANVAPFRERMAERGVTDPAAFFEAAGVGLSDGTFFGAPGFVRLNFGCPRATLDAALARMAHALGA